MYNESPPEFVVEQGMYYPSATSYGYICTGMCQIVDNYCFFSQVSSSLPQVYMFFNEQDWSRLVIGMTTIEFLVWMVKMFSS